MVPFQAKHVYFLFTLIMSFAQRVHVSCVVHYLSYYEQYVIILVFILLFHNLLFDFISTEFYRQLGSSYRRNWNEERINFLVENMKQSKICVSGGA